MPFFFWWGCRPHGADGFGDAQADFVVEAEFFGWFGWVFVFTLLHVWVGLVFKLAGHVSRLMGKPPELGSGGFRLN